MINSTITDRLKNAKYKKMISRFNGEDSSNLPEAPLPGGIATSRKNMRPIRATGPGGYKRPRVMRTRKGAKYRGLVALADHVVKEGSSYTCIELGAFAGDGTKILADRFQRVISVDPFTEYGGDRAGQEFQLTEAKKKFDLMRSVRLNVSHLQMPSIEASHFLGLREKKYDPKFDLVYIDARHDYESVRDDIEAWWGLTRFIGGHDYSHPRFKGVVRAVNELHDLVNHKFMPITDEIEISRGFSEVDSNLLQERKLHTFEDTSWLIDLSL